MPKIDPSSLIKKLISPSSAYQSMFIFTDDQIFKVKCIDYLKKTQPEKPLLFSEKDSINMAIDNIASGNLFGAPPSAVIDIDTKLTAKQWQETKKSLKRIPKKLESNLYFFAPLSLRNIIKEEDISDFMPYYICWQPNSKEAADLCLILAKQYNSLNSITKPELTSMINLALEHYANDFVNIDSHFNRMESGKLTFENALIGQTTTDAFAIVDSIVCADINKFELRVMQCQANNIPAPLIFGAVMHFAKQLVNLNSHIEAGNSMDQALKLSNIPYPSQQRFIQATKQIKKEKLLNFFLLAPQLELDVRTHKNAHDFLSLELKRLLF